MHVKGDSISDHWILLHLWFCWLFRETIYDGSLLLWACLVPADFLKSKIMELAK